MVVKNYRKKNNNVIDVVCRKTKTHKQSIGLVRNIKVESRKIDIYSVQF